MGGRTEGKNKGKWDIYYFEKHKLVISGLPKLGSNGTLPHMP